MFDATAEVNPFYNLQDDYMEVLPRIEGTRDYKNVSLYTSLEPTGRNTWCGKDGEEIPVSTEIIRIETLASFNNEPTLVVTFMELEEAVCLMFDELGLLNTKENPEAPIHVAHWGAITGRNIWRHCSKVFIYGLNRKPEHMYKTRQASMTGIARTFDEDKKKEVALEIDDLKLGDLVAELIQAMNRGQLRKTVDEFGNCDPTDVYITIDKALGWDEDSLKLINSQMPNITVDTWVKQEETSKIRVAKDDISGKYILAKLKSMPLPVGSSVRTTRIAKDLDLKENGFNKVIKGKKFLSLLSNIGYEIVGTPRKRAFRRVA